MTVSQQVDLLDTNRALRKRVAELQVDRAAFAVFTILLLIAFIAQVCRK